MSAKPDFFEKADQFFSLYYEEKYSEALTLAEEIADDYPEQDARTAFWLICMRNMTGQPEWALQTFEEALSRGLWWAEFLLRSDSDLASLQSNEEFERLVKRSEEMHRQAEANAKPELPVYQPEGEGQFPLLIVLGPRMNIPAFDVRDWSVALKLGWMVALPVSTQMATPISHTWDDRKKAFNEIEAHYQTLIQDPRVDVSRIVIAGFSQGAARAIELVMSGRLQARGFFAVVPGKLDFAELESWSTSDVCKARGVLISGGKDTDYGRFIQIKEVFDRHHLPLLFENFPEMAHQIPDDFESVLQKGLSFLLKENE